MKEVRCCDEKLFIKPLSIRNIRPIGRMCGDSNFGHLCQTQHVNPFYTNSIQIYLFPVILIFTKDLKIIFREASELYCCCYLLRSI